MEFSIPAGLRTCGQATRATAARGGHRDKRSLPTYKPSLASLHAPWPHVPKHAPGRSARRHRSPVQARQPRPVSWPAQVGNTQLLPCCADLSALRGRTLLAPFPPCQVPRTFRVHVAARTKRDSRCAYHRSTGGTCACQEWRAEALCPVAAPPRWSWGVAVTGQTLLRRPFIVKSLGLSGTKRVTSPRSDPLNRY